MIICERKPENLSSMDKDALEDLLSACRRKEPITLSVPDDGDGFLLAWEDETGKDCPDMPESLLACLVYCQVQEDEWECYAFTRPDNRRQGIFGRLLEHLCQKANEQGKSQGKEISLFFLSDGKSPDGLAAAESLGMEYWYSEYQMEMELKCRTGSFEAFCEPMPLEQERMRENPDEAGELGESLVFNAPVGTCRLLPYGGLRYYLYHVEIREEFRGKGWGGKLLAAVLASLPQGACVTLQVSSWNRPAVKLYKKTGFWITKTLSYYRFFTRG